MSDIERAELQSALASTRMEGYTVTEQTERDCVRLISGEVVANNLGKELLSGPTRRVM